MKKILILLLLLPLFCKSQQLVPIDTVDYAQKTRVVSKIQADSLAALMVRLGSTYSNPSWITAIAWSKISSAPTNVSSFTNDAGYLTTTSSQTPLSKSANYTIVSGDFLSGKLPILYISFDCTSGNVTATLPTASSFTGYAIYITKTDATANTLTISGLNQDNIIGTRYSVKTAVSNGSTWINN